MIGRRFFMLAAAAGSAIGAGFAQDARACGGFFCNNNPVDQTGEQIIFAMGDQHVTAYIQISYTGSAESFAWVVPVGVKPQISVGPRSVFNAVAAQTRPSFNLEWKGDTSCRFRNRAFDSASAGSGGTGGASADAGAPPVVVLDMREVGPYQTVTLESKDAGELIKRLNDNGYVQPPSSTPLIKHYVDAGMLFVALKLKKNATVGEIQPLVLDMDSDEACVPIILTQVAAVPNMPILVHVLAKHQAVPSNWFRVQIDQRKIDWFNGGFNYSQLVNQALDEAGGHGFVTEYAGPSNILKGQIYVENPSQLGALQGKTAPVAFMQALANTGLPRDQTMIGLLQTFLPMPDSLREKGVSEQQFYNDLFFGGRQYAAALGDFKVDVDKFIAAYDDRVTMPLRKAQAMFDDYPYLTRLFSTVSPDEMTRDPLFQLNADLPKVSNVHRAVAEAVCDGWGGNGTWITLEGGELLWVDAGDTSSGQWTYAKSAPAARRVELVGKSGKPTRYSLAQAKLADQYLDREAPESVRARDIIVPSSQMNPTGSGSGGAGCTAGGRSGRQGAAGASLFLLALGIAWMRRRRRG